MKRTLLFVFCFIFWGNILLDAQRASVAIGQWQSYLQYRIGSSIALSPDAVFGASTSGMFRYNRADHSIELLNKINGLSEMGIDVLEYSPHNNKLLIAYSSALIDIMEGNKITPVRDIRNAQITGDKSIYQIDFHEHFALLACGFGFVVYDLERFETNSFGITNVRHNAMVYYEGSYFISTETGLKTIDASANLQDLTQWQPVNQQLGIAENAATGPMRVFNHRLYVESGRSLYEYDGDQWEIVFEFPGYTMLTMNAGPFHLTVSMLADGYPDKLVTLDKDGIITIHDTPSGCIGRIAEVVEDEQGKFWTSDTWFGFHEYNSEAGFCRNITPAGPYGSRIASLSTHNGELWVAAGSIDLSWRYLYNREGFYLFNGSEWRDYREGRYPVLENTMDVLQVLPHPSDNRVFAGMFGFGLLETDRQVGHVKFFRQGYLMETAGDTGNYRVGRMAFDDDENLWMTNFGAPMPLAVYRNDGSWDNYEIPGLNFSFYLVIDHFGQKWISDITGGVWVFDDGSQSGQQRSIKLTTSNTELQTNTIRSLAVDRNGEVWVGTAEGVIVFQCAGQIFDQGCTGTRKIVEVEGIAAYLLENESINTIAIDGGNRKWIGTNNGIFVQSPDGLEAIYRFNGTNSPLFSDQIIDIAINHENGEVFIATPYGIQSFRGEATRGEVFQTDQVLVFPNPVRPSYTGHIAIHGLVQDAIVKITDISGRLVYETRALGGQAVWDGHDYMGRRAQTGVYLVYSTNRAGNQTVVTKILFTH